MGSVHLVSHFADSAYFQDGLALYRPAAGLPLLNVIRSFHHELGITEVPHSQTASSVLKCALHCGVVVLPGLSWRPCIHLLGHHYGFGILDPEL